MKSLAEGEGREKENGPIEEVVLKINLRLWIDQCRTPEWWRREEEWCQRLVLSPLLVRITILWSPIIIGIGAHVKHFYFQHLKKEKAFVFVCTPPDIRASWEHVLNCVLRIKNISLQHYFSVSSSLWSSDWWFKKKTRALLQDTGGRAVKKAHDTVEDLTWKIHAPCIRSARPQILINIGQSFLLHRRSGPQ